MYNTGKRNQRKGTHETSENIIHDVMIVAFPSSTSCSIFCEKYCYAAADIKARELVFSMRNGQMDIKKETVAA